MMKTALLLIDIQNDYFEGGKNPLEGSAEAVQQAQRLLAAFRRSAYPRVHIQHLSVRPGASFFVPGTPGVEIHAAVRPAPDECVFQKHFPNSFRDTELLEHLLAQGIDDLVIAGMMTQMCVDATVMAAYDYGFQCRVAQDACAARALTWDGETIAAAQVHRAFLAALNGTYSRVMTVDQLLAQLDLV